MKLLLDVPYLEKDFAKKNGAKWNASKKSWFIDDITKVPNVLKWLPKMNILCSKLYVFTMTIDCWKCGTETQVVCLGTDSSYSSDEEFELNKDLQLLTYVKEIPSPLGTYLKKKYGYFPAFSNFIGETYFINHCTECNSVQGDNFLHEIPEDAFYKKVIYKDSLPTNYYGINNSYIIPIFASLPYYDEVSKSYELILHHMETEKENRASVSVTQEKINGLFDVSNLLSDVDIKGL